MTFFNVLINKNISLQSGIKNDFNLDTNCNLWIPNDKLVLEYNKYLNNYAELNRLKYVLEYELIPKSKKTIKEFMKKSRSSNLEDRKEIPDIRNHMTMIEQKICLTENLINQLEKNDITIGEKWNEYLETAKDFLQSNNIDKKISINDILSNDRLYIMCNKLFCNYIARPDEYYDAMKHVNCFFDIYHSEQKSYPLDNIQYQQILEELSKFETQNTIDAISKAPNLFFRDADKNPIDYELNINNEPVELSDDKILILSEEAEMSIC
jgi:hypothetical protein